MTRIDSTQAEILVFTFKEGVLSPVAHDLKLVATRFEMRFSDRRVDAEVDAASLRVVCARRDGQDALTVLQKAAREEIEENIRNDVLRVSRYPTIRFESTGLTDRSVRGRLTLLGTTQDIEGGVIARRQQFMAEFQIRQTDFGIKPFRALLGTIRVKPELIVRVTVPVESAGILA